MSEHWHDIADAYLCPVCGYETRNPYDMPDVRCPVCGFKDGKDEEDTDG